MNENYQPRGSTATNNFNQMNNGPKSGPGPYNNRNMNNKNRYKNNNKNNGNVNSSNNRQNNFSNNDASLKLAPQFQNNHNANHSNNFNDFSASCSSNPPYNLEFGNQKTKKYQPFNKFNQNGAQPNMSSMDAFGTNGASTKKKRNKKKNKNSNAPPSNGSNNVFQRTNSFGNNITNNHYHVKPFSTDRLNKSLNREYSSSSNSSFDDINPRMQTSISLDNFESFSVNYKRSPTMPMSLSTFSHDQYSNVHTSPTNKTKFQRVEEPTIQESVEDDEKTQISHKPNEQKQQQQLSTTITSNHDDSVSFYSTPLNATKNDSVSSSVSSGLNEEQLAKFLNTVETCSSGSISPCSKVFNELSANNGESQLLVTASEGESSFELDAATEKTIINGAVEMSYDKELELLENCNVPSTTSEVPFSIKKMVLVMEDKESADSTTPILESENHLLSKNISPRTSSDSTTDNESPALTSYNEENGEISSTVLPSSFADIKSETVIDDYGLTPSFGNYIDLITPESLSIPHEHELNLADVQHQLEKDTLYLINEEANLKYSNIEEEEVNNLVNKIVVDVISHSAHADQTKNLDKEISSSPQIQNDSLHDMNKILESGSEKGKEVNEIIILDKNDGLKIDNILTNDNIIKNDESVLIEISSKEIDSILKKSVDSIEAKNSEKKETKAADKKEANKKDAVVDCFSCTIV